MLKDPGPAGGPLAIDKQRFPSAETIGQGGLNGRQGGPLLADARSAGLGKLPRWTATASGAIRIQHPKVAERVDAGRVTAFEADLQRVLPNQADVRHDQLLRLQL